MKEVHLFRKLIVDYVASYVIGNLPFPRDEVRKNYLISIPGNTDTFEQECITDAVRQWLGHYSKQTYSVHHITEDTIIEDTIISEVSFQNALREKTGETTSIYLVVAINPESCEHLIAKYQLSVHTVGWQREKNLINRYIQNLPHEAPNQDILEGIFSFLHPKKEVPQCITPNTLIGLNESEETVGFWNQPIESDPISTFFLLVHTHNTLEVLNESEQHETHYLHSLEAQKTLFPLHMQEKMKTSLCTLLNYAKRQEIRHIEFFFKKMSEKSRAVEGYDFSTLIKSHFQDTTPLPLLSWARLLSWKNTELVFQYPITQQTRLSTLLDTLLKDHIRVKTIRDRATTESICYEDLCFNDTPPPLPKKMLEIITQVGGVWHNIEMVHKEYSHLACIISIDPSFVYTKQGKLRIQVTLLNKDTQEKHIRILKGLQVFLLLSIIVNDTDSIDLQHKLATIMMQTKPAGAPKKQQIHSARVTLDTLDRQQKRTFWDFDLYTKRKKRGSSSADYCMNYIVTNPWWDTPIATP